MAKTRAQKEAEAAAANNTNGQEVAQDQRDNNGDPVPAGEAGYELADPSGEDFHNQQREEVSDKLREENAAMGAGIRNKQEGPGAKGSPSASSPPAGSPPAPSTGRNAGATADEMGAAKVSSEYHPDRHVVLDGAYVDNPEASKRPRTLNVGGLNYEHVGEDEHGVWTYRQM